MPSDLRAVYIALAFAIGLISFYLLSGEYGVDWAGLITELSYVAGIVTVMAIGFLTYKSWRG